MQASLLPPRTLAKISRLLGVDQKVYVQELIGIYETKARGYEQALLHLDDPYIRNQCEHFKQVLDELQDIWNIIT